MINTMMIDDYKAIIQYDPEIEMFRGEFTGLNGSSDFYAGSVEELKKEGETSLKVFLDMCAEKGIEPKKNYSGNFVLRVDPELHENLEAAAKANSVSLNKWASATLRNAASD